MTGNNTLTLNQTEIQKAVTLYLEQKVFSAEFMSNLIVANVESKSDGGYSREWTVKLEEKSESPK